MAEPERDLADPLLRGGIRKAPRHQPLENAADFVEGFEGGVKPKAIRLVRAEFHLGRVQQAQERSEEHTSELQSRGHLVCRLLLEKKKKKITSKIRIKEHIT